MKSSRSARRARLRPVLHAHHDHAPDGGLTEDLRRIAARLDRRTMLLRALAFGAGAAFVGCGGGGSSSGSGTINPPGDGLCTVIPSETNGPYPADGSNGPNVLDDAGIVRSDIRSTLGSAGATADGVPLTLRFLLTGTDCEPLVGYAVYAWHCDRLGRYSLYSSGVTGENYLRGVQVTDAEGAVTFTSIFPGCYPGRWPHVHFEVYESLAVATSENNVLRTSQLAFPASSCNDVYGTAGYETSAQNISSLSLQTDGIFADSYASQLAAMTGTALAGYQSELVVTV